MHAGVGYSPDAQDLSLEVTLLDKQVREPIKLYGADSVAVPMISFDEYANITGVAAGGEGADRRTVHRKPPKYRGMKGNRQGRQAALPDARVT